MDEKHYLIIGAQRPVGSTDNPGGILTATEGLLDFAREQRIKVSFLNVYSPSFPQPSQWVKVKRFFRRVKELWALSKVNRYDNAFIFCSGGLGFFERIAMVAVLQHFKTKTLLYVVSGHFMDQVNRSSLFRFVSLQLLKLPDMIGAQGQNWVNFYQSYNVDLAKIRTIRNWLPLSFNAKIKTSEHINGPSDVKFVYAGWIVTKKGIFELLDAVKASPALQECHFHLIGGGDQEKEAQVIIESERLTNVVLGGWMDHSDVQEELAKADVLVFPSHAEGFPNVLIEAMAHGLAIVATDVGAIADAIDAGVNGYLVPPKDTARLMESLEAIARDYKNIPAMGRRSREIVQDLYSYEKNCEAVFKAFSD